MAYNLKAGIQVTSALVGSAFAYTQSSGNGLGHSQFEHGHNGVDGRPSLADGGMQQQSAGYQPANAFGGTGSNDDRHRDTVNQLLLWK